MKPRTVRNRLLAAMVCLAVLPLMLLGVVLCWQSGALEKGRVEELQRALTSEASELLDLYVHEQELKLVALLESNRLPEMSREERLRAFLIFLSASGEQKHRDVFNEVAFLDAGGREAGRESRVEAVAGLAPRDRSREKAFLVPRLTGERYYGPVHFDAITGEPLMTIAIPVQDLRTLRFRGVLVAEMNLLSMAKIVADTPIGHDGIAFVTDSEGRVVAHPNLALVLKGSRFGPPTEPTIMTGSRGEPAEVDAQRIDFNGQALFVVTEVPLAQAFRQLFRSVVTIVIFLFAALAGAVGLWLVLVRQAVRPVEDLTVTARRIAAGDFAVAAELQDEFLSPADCGRPDEFGELAASLRAMTERLVATIGDLDKERNFVRSVIDSLSHPFYVVNVSDHTIRLANPAARFGDISAGATCHRLTHRSESPCHGQDHPCTIEEIRRTGQPVVLEHQHCLDGLPSRTYQVHGYPLFDSHGEVTQVIEYNIDITERKKLETQFQQAQRLEAVGSLAGGVAHDFNNILTTILGYSEMTLITIEPDNPLRKRFEAIHAAGERAADLTRQLLAFSRKQAMELKVFDLHPLIRNLAPMLTRLVSENVKMELRLAEQTGRIMADRSQVERVIMSLVANARDAMPEGGLLTIATAVVALDAEYCRGQVEVGPGRYVLLSVSDTGRGMPPEILEKIFEPFFTTKSRGDGTGLGLAALHGIVKQLDGHVAVVSEPGRGSTFQVYFPETQGEDGKEAEAAEALVPGRGTGTLLVVDDEPTTSQMVADTLTPLGYRVLVAASGEEAVRLFKEIDGKVDLLLTDVVMPDMNGRELADALTPLAPDLKVFFMSGYTDSIVVRQGVRKPGVLFIPKPLVPNRLAAKIRAILAAG